MSKIADWLELPAQTDRRPLRRTLSRHVAGEPLAKPNGGGVKPSLTHGEALVAANALQRGFAEEQAAYMVSAWRELKGKGGVSRTAVMTAFSNLGPVLGLSTFSFLV